MKMKAQFDSFTFVIVHDGAQSGPLNNVFSPVSLNAQLEGASVSAPPSSVYWRTARKNVEAFGQEGKSFNKSFQ